MMACILAGGEGTRLRPLTAFTPKPMVDICGKPTLEHILKKLSALGIKRAAITLMYLPEVISRGIGDGEEFGMEITYRVEEKPLGTAGAVRACLDLAEEGEEILVLSGDGISDGDIGALTDFHRKKGAEATICLARVSEPTEYGLVRCDGEGRVVGFSEKPDWKDVFTDLVNTGIYVFNRSALEMIPEGEKYDFSRDLFPRLLEKQGLFGFEAEGYWCDIGDPGAYLKCHMDCLEGRTGIKFEEKQISPGVWAAESARIAPDAKLIAPVLVCHNAAVGSGAILGPGVVVGPEAVVGQGAFVVGSVIYGELGIGAEAEDTIVCRGAKAGDFTVLRRGSILGPGAKTGNHSFIAAGGVLSENQVLADGTVKKSGTVGTGDRARFEEGELPADSGLCFSVGAAVGRRRVLVGSGGDEVDRVAAEAFTAGLLCGGAEVMRHDAGFAAGAAELGIMLKAEISFFIRGGRICAWDKYGRALSAADRKKLELGALRGCAACKCGTLTKIQGAEELIAAANAVERETGRNTEICVSGTGSAAETLKKALILSGFRVSNSGDALMLGPTADGFGVKMWSRAEFSPEHTVGMALLALAIQNPGKRIAIPGGAPAAFSLGVNRRGSPVLRVGRDAGAEVLGAVQKTGFFGIATAVRLADYIDSTGSTAEKLFGELPPYAVSRAEIHCETPKARLMRKLVGSFPEGCSDGVTVATERGSVTITPSALRASILVTAEAVNGEVAGSIASDIVNLAKKLDIRS